VSSKGSLHPWAGGIALEAWGSPSVRGDISHQRSLPLFTLTEPSSFELSMGCAVAAGMAPNVHSMRASAASARESQKVMSRARYSATAMVSSAPACSRWPALV
jgi:hypothetical protein